MRQTSRPRHDFATTSPPPLLHAASPVPFEAVSLKIEMTSPPATSTLQTTPPRDLAPHRGTMSRLHLDTLALIHAVFAALWGLQYHDALAWISRSWADATYDSWGFLPLLLAASVIIRGLPQRRPSPHLGPLGLALSVNLLDLLLAPLALHGLAAIFAVLSLAGLAAAFFRFPRGGTLLILILSALPLVFWADVLAGHHLQTLATRWAGAILGLHTEGTLLIWGNVRFAVDAACSGLHMLFSGLLLGALIQPGGRAGLIFWPLLAFALFLANVSRVVTLVITQVTTHHAPQGALHEAIGLVSFVIFIAPIFVWALSRRRRRDP